MKLDPEYPQPRRDDELSPKELVRIISVTSATLTVYFSVKLFSALPSLGAHILIGVSCGFFGILTVALISRSRLGWVWAFAVPVWIVLLSVAGFWQLAQRDVSARVAIAVLIAAGIFGTLRWHRMWKRCKPLFK